MKRYKYKMARALMMISGVVASTQVFLDMSGATVRKPGFEYTAHVCVAIFLSTVVYACVLLMLNAMEEK